MEKEKLGALNVKHGRKSIFKTPTSSTSSGVESPTLSGSPSLAPPDISNLRISQDAEKLASKNIDLFLKAEKLKYEALQKEPRLLILGTSDSGKSTLLKQLKILHGGGIPVEELEQGKVLVKCVINDTCRAILKHMAIARQEISDEYSTMISTYAEEEEKGSLSSLPILSELSESYDVFALAQKMWNDPPYKRIFNNLPENTLPPTNAYFMDHCDRISKPTYLPTNEDMLKLRTVTPNISETIFTIKYRTFHFYDVSGLKHDRKYWIPYFDSVTSILFVIDTSSYDQMMLEDIHTNRMLDTLTVWDFIVNHPLLSSPTLIVFFNKMDKFRQKAKEVEIKKYFPDYDGKSASVTQGFEYFRDRFKKVVAPGRAIECHPACATDTDTMRVIIDSMM